MSGWTFELPEPGELEEFEGGAPIDRSYAWELLLSGEHTEEEAITLARWAAARQAGQVTVDSLSGSSFERFSGGNFEDTKAGAMTSETAVVCHAP